MQICTDTSDATPLYLPLRLFLKPSAKINMTVQLPASKAHGKSLSSWDLMEKIRKLAQPEKLSALRVVKTSAESVRLEGETETRAPLERTALRLDRRTLALDAFPGELRVRAAVAEPPGPSRHAWDSFFRDAPDMDEMKPGERPDTVHVTGLPVAWFSRDGSSAPDEAAFRRAFEKFGRVRAVDVPAADPYRRDMKPHMTGFTVPGGDGGALFEGYVQYAEYAGFVRAMEALRGVKVVREGRGGEPAQAVDVRVDFDRSKHMTDAAVKRRDIVRERLVRKRRAEDELREKQRPRKKSAVVEVDGEEGDRSAREERRKRRRLAALVAGERGEVRAAVRGEERRLLAAQRMLQALRVLADLFTRIQAKQGKHGSREREGPGEQERRRVVRRLIGAQEAALDKQRHRLQRAYEGSIVLRAVLETRRPRSRSRSSSGSGSERPVKRELPSPPHPHMHPHLQHPHQHPLGVYGLGLPLTLPYAAIPPPDIYWGGGRGYLGPRYLPPPARGAPRGRGRQLYRGGPRMPYFEGPSAPHQYYKYFKQLSEGSESWSGHDDRTRRHRSRSRSHSRSRRRSRTRSYSRSRSRSRSRHRRSRTRSRSRSRSRHRHRSYTRSRSRSRSRTRSRDRDKRKSAGGEGATPPAPATVSSPAAPAPRPRSRSWSLPRQDKPD